MSNAQISSQNNFQLICNSPQIFVNTLSQLRYSLSVLTDNLDTLQINKKVNHVLIITPDLFVTLHFKK